MNFFKTDKEKYSLCLTVKVERHGKGHDIVTYFGDIKSLEHWLETVESAAGTLWNSFDLKEL